MRKRSSPTRGYQMIVGTLARERWWTMNSWEATWPFQEQILGVNSRSGGGEVLISGFEGLWCFLALAEKLTRVSPHHQAILWNMMATFSHTNKTYCTILFLRSWDWTRPITDNLFLCVASRVVMIWNWPQHRITRFNRHFKSRQGLFRPWCKRCSLVRGLRMYV